jgi:hypothetical protein
MPMVYEEQPASITHCQNINNDIFHHFVQHASNQRINHFWINDRLHICQCIELKICEKEILFIQYNGECVYMWLLLLHLWVRKVRNRDKQLDAI